METTIKTFTCGHSKTVFASVDANQPCNACRLAAELTVAVRATVSLSRVSSAERNLPRYDDQEDCNLARYRDSIRYGGPSTADDDGYYEGS